MDSDWLAAHATDKSYVKTTNGTGPYMVKEWVSGDHITMVANPNYTGPEQADRPDPDLQVGRHGREAPPGPPGRHRRRHGQRRSRRLRHGHRRHAPCSSSSATRSARCTSASTSTTRRGTTRPSARRSPRASTASGSSTCSTPRARPWPTTSPVQRGRRLRRRPLVRLQQGRGDRGPEGGQLRLQQDLRPVLPPEGSPVLPEPAGHRHRDPGPVQGPRDQPQDPHRGQRHLPDQLEQGPVLAVPPRLGR